VVGKAHKNRRSLDQRDSMTKLGVGKGDEMVNRYSYRYPFGWSEREWLDERPGPLIPQHQSRLYDGAESERAESERAESERAESERAESERAEPRRGTVTPVKIKTPATKASAPPEAVAKKSDRDEKLRELQEQLDRARANEIKLLAEFKNYRRHAEADLAAAQKKAHLELLAELADTVQALELARDAAATNPEAVAEGVALVARNLSKVFEAHGLSRIETAGQIFDPHVHEAVFTEPVEGIDKGTIVREVAPGFRNEQQVILPAKVSVAA
jgi:molecular chaperone GrpE